MTEVKEQIKLKCSNCIHFEPESWYCGHLDLYMLGFYQMIQTSRDCGVKIGR